MAVSLSLVTALLTFLKTKKKMAGFFKQREIPEWRN
jgi:hypothetical protein